MWPLARVQQRCQVRLGIGTSTLLTLVSCGYQRAGRHQSGAQLAKASRLLTNCMPVPQPSFAATGVAPQLRRMGGEKTSAMAAGTER